MGAFFSRDDLEENFVKYLMQDTGFTRTQIHRLYIRFQHLDKDKKGYLVEQDLLRIPRVRTNFEMLCKVQK